MWLVILRDWQNTKNYLDWEHGKESENVYKYKCNGES